VGALESVALTKAELRTSWLYQMTHAINTMPSLYLEAGAIQAACCARKAVPVANLILLGSRSRIGR
jgi:FdhD protein